MRIRRLRASAPAGGAVSGLVDRSGNREARAQGGPRLLGVDLLVRGSDVLLIDRLDAQLGCPGALVAAERAAKDLACWRALVAAVRLPDVLLDDDGTAARWAARRERLLQSAPQTDIAARVRGQGGERRVEVAQVGRPHHNVGEQARQGGRLAGVDAAQGADGVARDPCAPAVEVDHHVAGRGARVQLGEDDVLRRGRREALEGGQLRARIRADE